VKDGLALMWCRLERLQGRQVQSVPALHIRRGGGLGEKSVGALLVSWRRVVAIVTSPFPDTCAGTPLRWVM